MPKLLPFLAEYAILCTLHNQITSSGLHLGIGVSFIPTTLWLCSNKLRGTFQTMQGGSSLELPLIFIPRGKGAYAMKSRGKNRIAALFFTIATLICFMFTLTACGESEPRYETADLSASNYYGYVSLELHFDNFDAVYESTDSLGVEKYRLFCAGRITAKRIGNYQFEYASVTVDIAIENGWNVSLQQAKIPLDYDGNGEYSFYMEKTLMTSFVNNTFTSDDCEIRVTSASGTVRVYE